MDLSLATLEQIFDELKRRYAGVVLVREWQPPGEPHMHHFEAMYHGGITLAIGLCRRAEDYFLHNDETEWIDPDEGN